MHAAVHFALKQPCGFQHAHVFRDGGQRNAERLRQLRNHCLTLREAAQDGAPGRIGKRAERGIQKCRGIVNHLV
jgi:hypothetical protein